MQLATQMSLVRDQVRVSSVSLGTCPFCFHETTYDRGVVVEFVEWGVTAHDDCVRLEAAVERAKLKPHRRESFITYLTRSLITWINRVPPASGSAPRSSS